MLLRSLIPTLLILVFPTSCGTTVYENPQHNAPTPRPAIVLPKEWKGTSGDFQFRWNTNDLIFRRNGSEKIISITQKIDYKRFEEDRDCNERMYVRPTSIVGTYVSMDVEWGMMCGAVSSASDGIITIDVRKNGSITSHVKNDSSRVQGEKMNVSLQEVFDQKDVLEQLFSVKEIREGLKKLRSKKKIGSYPKNIEEIKALFMKHRNEFFDGFYVPMLEGFSFSDYKDGKVFVNLRLSDTSRAAAADKEEITLHFNPPEDLEEHLRLAKELEGGFFQKDVDQLIGDHISLNIGSTND